MTPQELKIRTESFARRIVRLCLPMVEAPRTRDLARQLLRSGTSANANYGSAQRGRSHDEFTSRLGQAYDDMAEAKEWLDLLVTSGVVVEIHEIRDLQQEATELTKILASAYRTAKATQSARRAKTSITRTRPIDR